MRGSLVQRNKKKGTYSIVLDLGYVEDERTGARKRRQKWIAFRAAAGTPAKEARKQAEAKLAELVNESHKGEFIEPSKVTLGEWLDRWLAESVRPSQRRSTYTMYELVVRNHLKPALGATTLQKLRPSHVKAYHAERSATHAGSTLQQHHAVLSGALEVAVTDGLVSKNVARQVKNRPKAKRRSSDTAKAQAWGTEETRRFLAAAKEAGSQWAAFFTLAIDTGMRKGEVCGLHWKDVDLEAATVTVHEQLLKPRWEHVPGCARPKMRPGAAACSQCGSKRPSTEPTFGPTKSKEVPTRILDISPETVTLLREHKREQAAVKMKNRTHYRDFGLVFAKDWSDLRNRQDALGFPLDSDHLGSGIFARLVKEAGVKPITLHGLRHTCATLLLSEGVPLPVVSQRLGHAKASITLDIYIHALPTMQRQAAAKMGALLANG